MKKLFVTLFFIACAIVSHAQFQGMDPVPKAFNQVKIGKLFWIATEDTTDVSASAYPGAIIFRSGDSSHYVSNGAHWIKLNTSAITTALDSARRSNDTLYFRMNDGSEIGVKIEGIKIAGVVGLQDSLNDKLYRYDSVVYLTHRIMVGNNTISSIDRKDSAAIFVKRVIEDTVSDNSRGFRDETEFKRNGYSYAVFDAASSVGAASHNHIISYQSRIGSRAGTNLTTMIGYGNYDTIFSGAVGTRYGAEIKDVALLGGTLGTNYGIRIWPFTSGTNKTSMFIETTGAQGALEIKHDAAGNITQALFNRATAGVGDQNLIKWKASSLEGVALGMELRTSSAADFVLKTNSTGTTNLMERLRVTGGGLTGVNEASPGAMLDVKGTSATTGAALRVRNSTPVAVFQVDNNGNITLFGGVMLLTGAIDPEGSISAPTGSLYLRSSGGAGTTFYVKETGSGNTGWVGK